MTEPQKNMSRQRFQIRFAKSGDLRMISHRDLVRTMERAFRRAELKLAMTEGFHPRPKMSFPSALSVGIAARDEAMELELREAVDEGELLDCLRQHAPPGLDFQSVRKLQPDERKGQLAAALYEYPVPMDRRDATQYAIDDFLARPHCLVERRKRTNPVDIRPGVQRLALEHGTLHLTLAAGREASARPHDVLTALGLADLEQQGWYCDTDPCATYPSQYERQNR